MSPASVEHQLVTPTQAVPYTGKQRPPNTDQQLVLWGMANPWRWAARDTAKDDPKLQLTKAAPAPAATCLAIAAQTQAFLIGFVDGTVCQRARGTGEDMSRRGRDSGSRPGNWSTDVYPRQFEGGRLHGAVACIDVHPSRADCMVVGTSFTHIRSPVLEHKSL
ncbi:unnamed protein product [Protopolystoma xenopodis]|uniref:Uncharacterized protein n=1 Tax=Protopolystoma xenopodis TaxID=117903 RepID=A0A448X242_9PLAT|nr:unnamed protein product [Protopolystoma xenopodis]